MGMGYAPERTWDQWKYYGMEIIWDGDRYPPRGVNRQTDTCENITSRRTTYAVGNNVICYFVRIMPAQLRLLTPRGLPRWFLLTKKRKSNWANRIITARIRRMGKVLFSQVSVCPLGGGGGLLHLCPIILQLVPCPFWGIPHLHSNNTGPMFFPGGTPCPSHNTSTGPRPLPKGYPSPRKGEYLRMGTPHQGWVTPQPGQGWGTPPHRTTEGVLATWRVVCLLHSCRRTFLFKPNFYIV